MSLLIRKIDKGKWLQRDICQGEDVPADAITNCLRTKHNTLSAWEITSENDIDEAVLAIVSGHQHLETIDVVPIDPGHLKENNIDCIRTDGLTPVRDLIKNHIDLSNLSYKKLGVIAYHIVDKIRDKKVRRYTEGRLKAILNEAIEKGRLEADKLSDSLRRKL
jgi:hypothetical protein